MEYKKMAASVQTEVQLKRIQIAVEKAEQLSTVFCKDSLENKETRDLFIANVNAAAVSCRMIGYDIRHSYTAADAQKSLEAIKKIV